MILRKLICSGNIKSDSFRSFHISDKNRHCITVNEKNSDSEADKATGEQILKGINEALSEYKIQVTA